MYKCYKEYLPKISDEHKKGKFNLDAESKEKLENTLKSLMSNKDLKNLRIKKKEGRDFQIGMEPNKPIRNWLEEITGKEYQEKHELIYEEICGLLDEIDHGKD